MLAAVASVLPDIDLPTAKIGRLFWFVSVPLERRFGHRTLTHSALMLLAVGLLASPLWLLNPLYFAALVGGLWGLLTIRTKSYAKDSKSFLDKSLQEPPDSGVRLERTPTGRQISAKNLSG